ncbi:MAG: Hpt domain-containing protein [Woeseiaceae bacterium]
MTSKTGKPIDIVDPFARRLVGKYLARRLIDVDNLLQAVRDSDFETVRITGHNLYGSGAAYGLHDISSIGANLENAAEDADAQQIERLIDDLKLFLDDLRVR